jgi:NAD(P)-dependent dehydrogenase (short-subunit alcohol dehydrogenase family)
MTDRDATVLVTGATGGLGPSVVAALLKDGWRVVATSRSGRPPQELVGHDRLESVATDLFEPADVAEAVTVAAADPAAARSGPWSTWSAASPSAAWSTRHPSSSSSAS